MKTSHRVAARDKQRRRVDYDPPPIPSNGEFDYQAVSEDYEPGHPIGYGRTAVDALLDLDDKEAS